jgi:hypothetical protein
LGRRKFQSNILNTNYLPSADISKTWKDNPPNLPVSRGHFQNLERQTIRQLAKLSDNSSARLASNQTTSFISSIYFHSSPSCAYTRGGLFSHICSIHHFTALKCLSLADRIGLFVRPTRTLGMGDSLGKIELTQR